MIDVSDGLLLDARRLCRSSGTGLRLNTDHIPLRGPGTSLREALTDGEDYELLFAVAQKKMVKLVAAWPFEETPLTTIPRSSAIQRAPSLPLKAEKDLIILLQWKMGKAGEKADPEPAFPYRQPLSDSEEEIPPRLPQPLYRFPFRP
jgi:hypothetical protein